MKKRLVSASVITVIAVIYFAVGTINTVEPTIAPVEAKREARTAVSNDLSKPAFTTSAQPAPVKHQCTELSRVEQEYKLAAVEKSETLAELASSLNSSQISMTTKEQIFQLSGGDLDEFRVQNSWHADFYHSDLKPVVGKHTLLPAKVNNLFMQYFFTENYDGIFELVENGSITSSSIFGGKSIISFIIMNRRDIDLAVVSKLVNLGLEPNFSDLVNATKRQQSREVLEVLRGNIEISKVWYEEYKQYSLSLVAAEAANYDLFELWHGLGSPLETTEFDYSVLDVLPVPRNDNEKENLVNIFEVAAAGGVLPYKSNSVDMLLSWLPHETIMEYRDYFNKIDENFIYQLEKLALNEAQLESINSYKDYVSKLNLKTKTYTDLALVCDSEFELIKTDKEIRALARKKIENVTVETINKLDKLDSSVREAVVSLNVSLDQQDWQGYWKKAKLIATSGHDSGFTHLALLQMINADAPFSIIETAILDGADLNPNTIFGLVRNGNLELASKLLKYDLKLTNENGSNQDIIEFAKQVGDRESMIRFIEDNTD